MSFCGDGILDAGELCDLGPANADRPALLVAQPGLAFAASPFQKAQSAVSFYNYFSASGHTGFEALDASVMFFYRNTTNSILSLIFEHGIDLDTSGQTQAFAHVIFDITGVPSNVAIAAVDDQGEVFPTGPTSARADWQLQNNTDGAVFAGFPFPGSWTVTVTPQLFQGLTSFSWVTRDGSKIALSSASEVTLTAFNSPSICRTDCTIPTCGDGILDGGEICDDGNNVGGDGCSADCKALQ